MFSIKNVCNQRINCDTFYKLRSEKFKNTMLYKPWNWLWPWIICYINPDILVTMVSKLTRSPPPFPQPCAKQIDGLFKLSIIGTRTWLECKPGGMQIFFLNIACASSHLPERHLGYEVERNTASYSSMQWIKIIEIMVGLGQNEYCSKDQIKISQKSLVRKSLSVFSEAGDVFLQVCDIIQKK